MAVLAAGRVRISGAAGGGVFVNGEYVLTGGLVNGFPAYQNQNWWLCRGEDGRWRVQLTAYKGTDTCWAVTAASTDTPWADGVRWKVLHNGDWESQEAVRAVVVTTVAETIAQVRVRENDSIASA